MPAHPRGLTKLKEEKVNWLSETAVSRHVSFAYGVNPGIEGAGVIPNRAAIAACSSCIP